MLEAKFVGDNSRCHQDLDSVAKILELSPTVSHQHHNVTDMTVAFLNTCSFWEQMKRFCTDSERMSFNVPREKFNYGDTKRYGSIAIFCLILKFYLSWNYHWKNSKELKWNLKKMKSVYENGLLIFQKFWSTFIMIFKRKDGLMVRQMRRYQSIYGEDIMPPEQPSFQNSHLLHYTLQLAWRFCKRILPSITQKYQDEFCKSCSSAYSMLVTDVGDGCLWQNWNVCGRFEMFMTGL